MSDLFNLLCGSFLYFLDSNDVPVLDFIWKPGSNSVFEMRSN